MQLEELEEYIAKEASVVIARRYVAGIVEHCRLLADFPLRGTIRDDLQPGLRTLSFRRRPLIAFTVGDMSVDTLAVFHGSKNWEDRFLD